MTETKTEELSCRRCDFAGSFEAMETHLAGAVGTVSPAHAAPTLVVWGGELDEGEVHMWTVSQIRNSLEQAHYAGFQVWEHIAWLLVSGADIEARKCSIRLVSTETDESFFIHAAYEIVDSTSETLAVFRTPIDGRA